MNRFLYISPLILQTAIWPITRPLLWFFLRLEVQGTDNLQPTTNNKQGVIFAANHSSEMDPILIPASLPFLSRFMPMFYTSRERSFYHKSGWRQLFYGGLLFELWGSHALHSGKQNYEASLQTHIEILNAGKSVIMFPDGRCLPESEIGTIAHGGVGYLAWRTKAIIIPVRMTHIHNISLLDAFFRRRHVRVIFGEPFTSEKFLSSTPPTVADCKEIATAILKKVRELAPTPASLPPQQA